MSESCTIILAKKNFLGFLASIQKCLLQPTSIAGTEDNWERIEVVSNGNSIVFTSLVRVTPSDQFSKLVLGLHNFARKLHIANPTQLTRLLEAIANAEMLVGVVAIPRFSAETSYEESIFATAESLNGIVFTGNSFIAGSGEIFAEEAK